MLARHAEHAASMFPCGAIVDLRGPVARGEQGEVWRLETTRGTWALKVLFEPPPEAEARADAEYQAAVRSAGVPMPAVVRADGGDVLCEVDGIWLRMYEWVELADVETRLDPAAVGELFASIHRVRSVSRERPVDDWYNKPVGAVRWHALFAAVEARGAPTGVRLGGLLEECVALEHLLASPRDLQVCHRDLWADNVRRTPAGGLCVIDWENGGLADPNQELAIALFEYGLDDSQRERSIYEAYVENGGTGRIERPRDFSMLIAQLGHIFEWACIRWTADGIDEVERARAAGSIREFADRAVTRAMVDRMLEAIA